MAKKNVKKSAVKKVAADKKEEVKIEDLQVNEPVVVSSGGGITVAETVPPADLKQRGTVSGPQPPESDGPTGNEDRGPNANEILKAYMISSKGIDSIKQVSKGGNFASSRSGEIFIPISVVNQIIAAK